MTQASPVRRIPLGPRDVAVSHRDDGALLLRSPHALQAYPHRLTERLAHWARARPAQTWIAQREAGGGWRKLSYAEGFDRVRALAQALLDRGLSVQRPLAILSENDIEHALLAAAALHVGIPFAAISPAYALVAKDFSRLRHIIALLTPGLVFAADGMRFSDAIHAAVPARTPLLVTQAPVSGYANTLFHALQSTAATAAVDQAHAAIAPDGIAKFLFTSGSTSHPKAVIHSHRMLTSNLQMITQALPYLAETVPIIVDWLPWNHTFGGNHNYGLVLYHGGILYIDEGRPLPGAIERTARNLEEIAPTVYFNVPRGYELLAPHLRTNAALRRQFFSRLGMLFYAGAGLSQPVWDAYEAMAVETLGERILWVTGLGATETAPSVTFTTWDGVRAGMIGLPVPGVEVKLTPINRKLEMRVRGPSVSPGYWRDAELTRAAFDDEGYYRMGDAVRFVDPDDPLQGLLFDGRIGEDFKLGTGTWVSVGPLRTQVIAAGAPYVRDVVIAGHDRAYITALIFPDLGACRALCPQLPRGAADADVLATPAVRMKFESLFEQLAHDAPGSSTRIERVLILVSPPSIDAGELTDKGSINQRAVLDNRTLLVERLYAEPAPPDVLHVPESAHSIAASRSTT
jgi:feruloyl-CoA synthase